MNRATTAAFLISIVIWMTGCVTQSELQSADYGARPTDAAEQCNRYFDTSLKDPYTAHIVFGRLDRGFIKMGLIMGGKTEFGWIQKVSVNAKNSFGGYTGFEDYYLFFQQGKLVRDVTDMVKVARMGGFVD